MKKSRWKYYPPTEEELAAQDIERTRRWMEEHGKTGTAHDYRVLCSSGHIEGRGVKVVV